MHLAEFTTLITGLPQADIPVEGVRAWILAAEGRQIAFFDIDPIGAVAEHTHEEQWGIVVEGEMSLTIGGVTKVYRQGDSYRIPAGVPHGATFASHFRAIDVFATATRYRAKGRGAE